MARSNDGSVLCYKVEELSFLQHGLKTALVAFPANQLKQFPLHVHIAFEQHGRRCSLAVSYPRDIIRVSSLPFFIRLSQRSSSWIVLEGLSIDALSFAWTFLQPHSSTSSF